MAHEAATTSSSSSTARVLVIGGGFAGAALAVKLAKHSSIALTFVSRTPFFEVSFANARTVTEPSLAGKAIWPIEDMKPHGTFVQGDVVSLSDSEATLSDGRVLAFDWAAIATGSSYAVGKATEGAVTTEGRRAEVEALAATVAAAASVLIVGGGPLGVELAGEICEDLPRVRVTLVHGSDRLLPSLPASLGAAARAWLEGKGCKVLLSDRVDVPASAAGCPFSGATKAGVALAADVVLVATGIRVNSALMRQHLAETLDAHGRIKVTKRLQVVGHPRLFALGDVTDVPEEKLAFLAAQQGSLVADSIAALAAARAAGGAAAVEAAAAKLRPWRPSMGMQVMFVSLGRNHGVGRIGWLKLTGWLPTRLKSRNIEGFTDKYRQQLLQQP